MPRTATWADILPGAHLSRGPVVGAVHVTVEEVVAHTHQVLADGTKGKEGFWGHSPQYGNDRPHGWVGHKTHVDTGKYQLLEPAPEARPERF